MYVASDLDKAFFFLGFLLKFSALQKYADPQGESEIFFEKSWKRTILADENFPCMAPGGRFHLPGLYNSQKLRKTRISIS